MMQKRDMGLNPLKIAVCIPCMDYVPVEFAFCLASMLVYTTQTLVNDGIANMVFLTRKGTYAHSARNDLAQEALDAGADYILWLDSDMTFPKDIIVRLLSHDKLIVGANYSTRGLPLRSVAIKKLAIEHDGEGEQLNTLPESTGLEEVEAIGFGALMTKATVFRNLEEPWFFFRMEGEDHVGEDVWFSQLARQAGYTIYADHDLSKIVSHIGTYQYDTMAVARLAQDVAKMMNEEESEGSPTLELVKD